MSDFSAFLRELRRRKVIRVAGVYAVVAWLVVQVADTTFPHLGLPDWTITLVIALAVLGFPIALVLAWAFEATPEGVRRTGAPARSAPPVRHTGRDNRRLTAGVVLGFLIAVVGLGTYGWIEEHEEAGSVSVEREEISRTAVAVLPFSYHGSPGHEYLGEGIVDLLGAKLDGVGALRSVDPHALLSTLRRESDREVMSPDHAREVARRVGAAQFILGSITEVGGRIQLRATLYGPDGEPVATARADPAEEADLFGAVDALARDLLAHELEDSGDPLPGLAARTTSSISALKAYLGGEQLLRQGRGAEAGERFETAIGQDSAFALAHYSLAVASGWGHVGSAAERIERALAHADRLPEQERTLLEAFRAYTLGDARQAERLYRSVVARAPEHVAAWFGLGEVLLHQGVLVGKTPTAAREPFERVLAYVPDHAFSLYHLSNVAAAEDRATEIRAIVERMRSLAVDEGLILGTEIQFTALAGDSARQAEILAAMPPVTPPIGIAMGSIALGSMGELEGARRMVDLIARNPAYSDGWRAEMFRMGAEYELGRGRWDAAQRRLDDAGALDPGLALRNRAHLAATPFLSTPEATLRNLRRRLQTVDPEALREGNLPGTHVRLFLLGLLSARLGEEQDAMEYAEALAALPAALRTGSLQRDLAMSIRAQTHLAQRRPERALAALEAMAMEIPVGQFTSGIGSLAHARLLRAELLHRLGQEEQALRWYAAAMQSTMGAPINRGPALLAMARIHEARGEREEAIEHYARLIELWEEADPELRPKVEEARQRLAQLTADTR